MFSSFFLLNIDIISFLKYRFNEFQDWTELQKCASAVRQLELLVGGLPNLRCKGKWAAQVVEIVKKMRTQVNNSFFIWYLSDSE